MQLRYILSTLAILWANCAFAQSAAPVTQEVKVPYTKVVPDDPRSKAKAVEHENPFLAEKGAEKLYNKATELFRKGKHEDACATMRQAISADPSYTYAYSALGEWYFKLRKYDQAVDVFRMASSRCKNGQKDFARPLARSLLYNQSPGEALALINTYGGEDKTGEWKLLRQQSNFMLTALGKMWKDTVENMGIRINTKYPELYPYITADTQTLYFTRRVKGMDEDFFYAKADSCGGWFAALNMGNPPNTADHEYAQTYSVDGHYMFFTKCENRSENGWDKGGCDLYMCFRKDTSEKWSAPENFGATINTPGYEGMACLSPDNRELYFVSNRDSGYGGKDIWVSRFEEGYWQKPRNLGPEINTKGDELAPHLHMDNKTLYFSSNGLPGMGGSDLYYCRRINDSTWSEPKNMGYPINSTGEEVSITVTEDGKRMYFASDREKIAGDFDLYEVKTPNEALPVPVNKIVGYVYDSFSKERLNYTAIFIYDPQTDEELYHFNANRGDASFMITLPAGKDYICRADGIGHMERVERIHVDGREGIELNISLLPDGYIEPIEDSLLFTIHFPVNGNTLTEDDRSLIYSAMAPWLSDGAINIFINGYTDSRGNPLLNEQLSFERAGLVSGELVVLGINADMIEVKGWGEANPVGDNETEEGQAQNRRVEVKLRR